MKSIFALAVLLVVSVSNVNAHSAGIDARQSLQYARISAGVMNGSLNAFEARRLYAREAGINRAQAWAARDGLVTYRERLILRNRADRTSYAIYRHRHNGRWCH
jgi:hypothetical protein